MSERVFCDDPNCTLVGRRGNWTGTWYFRPHYVDEHPAPFSCDAAAAVRRREEAT